MTNDYLLFVSSLFEVLTGFLPSGSRATRLANSSRKNVFRPETEMDDRTGGPVYLPSPASGFGICGTRGGAPMNTAEQKITSVSYRQTWTGPV